MFCFKTEQLIWVMEKCALRKKLTLVMLINKVYDWTNEIKLRVNSARGTLKKCWLVGVNKVLFLLIKWLQKGSYCFQYKCIEAFLF